MEPSYIKFGLTSVSIDVTAYKNALRNATLSIEPAFASRLAEQAERDRQERWATDPMQLGQYLSIEAMRSVAADALYWIAGVVDPHE